MTDFSGLGDLGEVTASLVVGPSGEHSGPDGSSAGLGNLTDRQLLIFLRTRAEIVLTSGLTARMENYRMPKSADLAIFTKGPAYRIHEDSARELIHIPHGIIDFAQAVEHLRQRGYRRIHTEFGPTGFLSLATLPTVTAIISSQHFEGIVEFCRIHDVDQLGVVQLEDLYIARVVQRGSSNSAAI